MSFLTFDDALIWFARRYGFVREVGGANRGTWVELFQSFTGGMPGDSWCGDWLSFVLASMCGGYTNMPIPRTGVCEVIHAHAIDRGWISSTPSLADVYLFLDSNSHAHHCGLITQAAPLTGIAGNTSADGTSSNGDGVYEHALHVASPGRIVFVHYPRPTYIEAST